MAQPKNCVTDIPAIYRADTIDHILLGYVRGCKSCDPDRSVADITLSFLHDFDLEATFDKESAMVAYRRVSEKYLVAFQRVNAKLRENKGKL